MDYISKNQTFFIRVDKDESVVDAIQTVCRRENIQAGFFQGIGACDLAVLSSYLPGEKEFVDYTMSGMIEMVSLMGNISSGQNGEPVLHGHAVFSYLDHGVSTVRAGHLKDARISYTGEMVLEAAEVKINRMIDPKTGIEVWKLRS